MEREPLPVLAPEGIGSGSADPPLVLLASGGSDSEEEEERPWRHNRSSTRSPPGLVQPAIGSESAGEPPRASSLERAAPGLVARSTDRSIMAARAGPSHGPIRSPPGPAGPSVGRESEGVTAASSQPSSSQVSSFFFRPGSLPAVREQRPVVSTRTFRRPAATTAGPLPAPPSQAAPVETPAGGWQLSGASSTGTPPAGQPQGSPPAPPKRKKKPKKRAAAAASASPSAKRAKKGKKKRKVSGVQPSEAELLAMMSRFAESRGWAFAEQSVDTPAAAAASFLPADAPPGAAPLPRQRVGVSRAPAALGAPPGEESFPVEADGYSVPGSDQATAAGGLASSTGSAFADVFPPLQTGTPSQSRRPRPASGLATRAQVDYSMPPANFPLPLTAPNPSTSLLQGLLEPSAASGSDPPTSNDWDSMSTSSAAPSLAGTEAPPGLRHLSEEAEALLLRYLEEFYTVRPDPVEHQPPASRLFRGGSATQPGIPLTADFKEEYGRIAREPPKGSLAGLRRAFSFQPADMARYLEAETLSPELLALGDYVGKGNPLRRRAFLEDDRRWTHVATLARSTMRLAAYAGALANLAVQADDLRVSPEDRQLLDSLLLSISELLWKHSTRTALFTTRRRRDLALEALGFPTRQRAQLTDGMSFEGPFLFSGQFAPRIKEALARCQQARELAGQLRSMQAQSGRPRGPPRQTRAPTTRRVTVTMPPPQAPRRSNRGRRHHRGGNKQRGSTRPAAKGRGGF